MSRMRKSKAWFVPLGLMAVLLAGCGGGTDAGSRATGIRGVVVEGPPRTSTQRLPGVTVIVYGHPDRPDIAEEVARATSDSRGEFFVEVPPDQYVLQGDPRNYPDSNRCFTRLPVSVSPNQVASVVVGYDVCATPN